MEGVDEIQAEAQADEVESAEVESQQEETPQAEVETTNEIETTAEDLEPNPDDPGGGDEPAQ
jgi:hypothetical protein